MSSVIMSGSPVHDQNCLTSLGKLQAAIAGTPTQVAVNAAYVTHLRNCRASAIANGCGHEPFDTALRALNAGGV
jgi:hypothetical protein